MFAFLQSTVVPSGLGSVVGIATGYGLDGPGIESRWEARISAPVQTGPGAHPASCTMGTGSFLGVKSSWGMTLNPHPLLVPWSRKGRAIPVLPLWAVRPVQSLTACTRVHFTFTFTVVSNGVPHFTYVRFMQKPVLQEVQTWYTLCCKHCLKKSPCVHHKIGWHNIHMSLCLLSPYFLVADDVSTPAPMVIQLWFHFKHLRSTKIKTTNNQIANGQYKIQTKWMQYVCCVIKELSLYYEEIMWHGNWTSDFYCRMNQRTAF
jgi:hypothetical protein